MGGVARQGGDRGRGLGGIGACAAAPPGRWGVRHRLTGARPKPFPARPSDVIEWPASSSHSGRHGHTGRATDGGRTWNARLDPKESRGDTTRELNTST